MKQVLVHYSRCTGCKTCELACCAAHSDAGDLFGAFLNGEKPVRRVHVAATQDRSIILPLQCRQCRDPQCVKGCMSGAMSTDEQTGLVRIQEEKCVGCFMCAMVCPYGSVNEDSKNHKAVKCDQCVSLNEQPACVAACPTKALELVEVGQFDKKIHGEFLTRFAAEKGENK